MVLLFFQNFKIVETGCVSIAISQAETVTWLSMLTHAEISKLAVWCGRQSNDFSELLF